MVGRVSAAITTIAIASRHVLLLGPQDVSSPFLSSPCSSTTTALAPRSAFIC